MPEAVTLQSSLLPRTPVAFPSREIRSTDRSTTRFSSPALPTVRPGQLWFGVLCGSEQDLPPLLYRAVTTVNVILYDPAFAATVARLLPLGGYAEPAAALAGGYPTVERCLGFVRDGWSVARLVDRGRDWRGEIHHLSAAALSGKAPADLPVTRFADRGGHLYESSGTRLDELDDLIAGQPAEPVPFLTFVFEAIATDAAPRLSAASTNGLAG